jgi:protein TonB
MSRGGLPLAACAAVSLLAHAALIGTLAGNGPRGGRPGASGPATVLHASVRTMSPADAAPAAFETAPVVVAAARVAPEVGELRTDAAPLPEIAAPVPQVRADGDDFDGYVPRALLTVPPEVKGTAEIGWPDTPGLPDGHYHETFTLYIDETGTVRRVEPEGDGLPAPLLDRARQTFLAARFEPGQVNGRIVKSRIRIAVDFESHATATSHRF